MMIIANSLTELLQKRLRPAALIFFIAFALMCGACLAESNQIILKNEQCAIGFDGKTGALAGIENLVLKDQVLKAGPPVSSPFRLHADFDSEWLLDTDPEKEAKVHIGPGDFNLSGVRSGKTKNAQWIELKYLGQGFECKLKVSLADGTGDSEWALSVQNVGKQPRSVIIDFPRLDSVQLGAPDSKNMQTVMEQAGFVDEAWKSKGNVYGRWTMQWHTTYDPASHSALGFIVQDPKVLNKFFRFVKPTITVRYFPSQVIQSGESIKLPPVKLFIYEGDYHRTAREYAKWYEKAFKPVKPPKWFANCDGITGMHFKKGESGDKPDYPYQYVLDNFRDLPSAHMMAPTDNTEYAFWTRGSMLYGAHTDGDDYFREDLGGAEAMRDAVTELHKLGIYTSLYIEGYIVSMKSDLAKQGKAHKWSVMHRDGSIEGNYTSKGFYHMCPGCVEWQDHLVSVVTRVLRETGSDAVRLDSFGFYFLPCYNPAHHHASPFDYNKWMQQLLSKVRKAALEVNPNVGLTTEGPADFFGRYFPGSLTQVYPRDISLMRIAVPTYRPVAYSGAGPVWTSISGFLGTGDCTPSNKETPDFHWICVQSTIHDAFMWGDVADEDPKVSDPEIVTRRFIGKDCDVITAVRPECKDARWPWPNAGDLSDKRGAYQIRIPFSGKAPAQIAVCDIEKLEWTRMRSYIQENEIVVPMESNWIAVVVPRGQAQVVGFDPLPEVSPGGSVTIRPMRLAGQGKSDRVEVWAPGLVVGNEGKSSANMKIGDEIEVFVPAGTYPGWYRIQVKGTGIMGVRRLLHVVPRKEVSQDK
jgi:hypothetical protein